MLINGVDMNIKRKPEPEGFYFFALSNDTKTMYQNLRRYFFISQVELKPLLLLAHANVYET